MVFLCLFLSFAVYSLIPLRCETGTSFGSSSANQGKYLGLWHCRVVSIRHQVADDEALYWDLAAIVGIFHSILHEGGKATFSVLEAGNLVYVKEIVPNNCQLIIAVSTGKVLKQLIITTSLCSEGGCLTCFLFVLAPDRFHDPNSPPESDIAFSKVIQDFPGGAHISRWMFCPCTGLTSEPGHLTV